MKNKTITVYELMTKKKNKEKLPLYIRFLDKVYTLNYPNNDYINDDEEEFALLFKDILCIGFLNNLDMTVEILDEENDKFEDIITLIDNDKYHFMNRQNGMTQEDRRLLDSNFKTLGDTINQLIRNQKLLIERLNKDE